MRYQSPRLLLTFVSLLGLTSAADILKLSDFQDCASEADIKLNSVDIEYDGSSRSISFSIDGTSSKSEKVQASLQVQAYGKDVYTKDFNPCDEATSVPQLCPVPVGRFNASSTQVIPAEFASQIPSIAFSVPDIALTATLQLNRIDDGASVGCVVADLSNGKSLSTAGVTYAAAGIVGGALVISGAASLVSAMQGGFNEPGEQISSSPSFTTMIGWFQTIATTGMISVQYPAIYQGFTTRFAFSTGLISWQPMQNSIDNLRAKTGGKVVEEAVQNTTSRLMIRQSQTAISSNVTRALGMEKFVEETGIRQENVFMTIFLVTMIIIALIVVLILLFKVILEAWALLGSFPKGLTGFRKHYWGSIFRAVVMLINLIFPIWVLYSIYQFQQNDSWTPTLLAAVSLAVFAAILIFFIVRIWMTAQKQIKISGSVAGLFEDKEMWIKYSMFYDNLKRDTWWFFAVYLFYGITRNALLGGLQGKGLAQTISILTVDILMLIVMCFLRPFEHRTENVVHILIQVVRALSIGAVLVFVDTLKVERSTQTVIGLVLVIVTAVLTVLLVGLMLFNGIYQCVKSNPHRKRRKEAEKMRNESEYFLEPTKNQHNNLDRDFTNDTSYRSPAIVHEGRRNSYFAATTPPATLENRRLIDGGASMGSGGAHNDYTMTGAYRDDVQPKLPNVEGRPL